MKAKLCALVGLMAYAVALGTMAYLVAFGVPGLAPKGVDDGAPGPAALAVAVDFGLLALFGLQHSVMARRGFKSAWRRRLPEPIERPVYLLASCAALGLLFWLWRPLPTPRLWTLESPGGVGLAWGLCALGWGLALWSTFLLDHAELFGLRQALGRPSAAPAGLRTPGPYRWVRHPLYLGMLLGLWATPRLSAGHALYAGGFTFYALIGIVFEERDLRLHFGEAYQRYRRNVGMLLPWRKPS
jgi:protein-S-isoprenylcysteine O-methyltransferase Ste14